MIDLTNRRVLVTGGAGFVGSHTVDALLQAGASVAVVDNVSTGRRENLNPAARFYDVNLADPAIAYIVAQERPDIIYHLAFFVLVPQSVANPLLDMDVLAGSLRLLEAARRVGTPRVVLASSGFLYGNTPDLPASETCPVDPVSPYVVSKYAIEQYLRFYRRAYGLAYAVVRYAAVYGPRQVTGAMADYIRKLAAGQQADIWGDGTKTRDYVYVGDAVDANLRALNVPADHPYPVFNVGTGKETTLNALYWHIAALLGREPKPVYHPDRPGEQMRYCLDSTKAQRELGWSPRVSLEEGLRRTVDAYQGSGNGDALARSS